MSKEVCFALEKSTKHQCVQRSQWDVKDTIFLGLPDTEEKLEFFSATSHLRVLTTKEMNVTAGTEFFCLTFTEELGHEGEILLSVTWHLKKIACSKLLRTLVSSTALCLFYFEMLYWSSGLFNNGHYTIQCLSEKYVLISMLLFFSRFLFPPAREGMTGHLHDMFSVLFWIRHLTIGFHFKEDSQVSYCQQ